MDKILIQNEMPGVIIDEESKVSAVIIPIVIKDGEPNVLFEVRASSIPDQPGDICFPGGIIEEGESPRQAAIRECCEELCITEDQCQIIGPSILYHAPAMSVFPFIAELKDYQGTFSKSESAEVFLVPLSFFKENEPERFKIEWKRKPIDDFPYDRIVGGKNYKWRRHIQSDLFYNYQGKDIWGITAKIIYYSLVKYGIEKYKL